jgi:hypothetical protein
VCLDLPSYHLTATFARPVRPSTSHDRQASRLLRHAFCVRVDALRDPAFRPLPLASASAHRTRNGRASIRAQPGL